MKIIKLFWRLISVVPSPTLQQNVLNQKVVKYFLITVTRILSKKNVFIYTPNKKLFN